MKIAVIADIHGNIVALDAVLAAIDAERPDRVVCLGDVAAKGPAPAQAVDRLIDRDWTFIMGNTDEWMIRPIDEKPKTDRERLLIESALWGFKQLDARQRAFIAAFRPTPRSISAPDNCSAITARPNRTSPVCSPKRPPPSSTGC